MLNATDPCPCGSETEFKACCGPYLAGGLAPTALALMRSRYTAYSRGDIAYLMRTWHPGFAPAGLDLNPVTVWTRLRILGTTAGGPDEMVGTVHFRAHYREGTERGAQEENSRFSKVDGAWLYEDGDLR